MPNTRTRNVLILHCSVTAYSTSSASLTMGHVYPQGTNVSAVVNVELLLETLQSELTRVGEWVNVIGYIEAKPRRSASEKGREDVPSAHVQALVIWPTGPLNVHQYEATFQANATQTHQRKA